MRLPTVSPYVAQSANTLYQSMLQNQIMAAQANYAPQLQQGLAAQEYGAGQNALAQGAIAVPYANALLSNAQLQPGATQANIALAQAETQNVGNTALQVAPNAAANRALQTAQTFRTQNPNASIAQIIAVYHEALNSTFNAVISNVNASGPPSQSTNPNNYVPPATTSQNPSGASVGIVQYQGENVPYTSTQLYNGKQVYWVPSLNHWVG